MAGMADAARAREFIVKSIYFDENDLNFHVWEVCDIAPKTVVTALYQFHLFNRVARMFGMNGPMMMVPPPSNQGFLMRLYTKGTAIAKVSFFSMYFYCRLYSDWAIFRL